MNNNRIAFTLILDGRYTGITVFGWKNIRSEAARQTAKGHTVGWVRA